jgi:hypothetical protein
MTHGPLRDSKSDLLEAARAAVRDREEKAAEYALAARSVPRRGRRLISLVTVGVVGAVLIALQPAWLVGPKSVPPEPAPVAAAGLRVAMIRQRQLVFDYARAHAGRLPLSLAESGDSVAGVTYQRRGDSLFTLTGSTADSVVVLQSSDTQAVFLGSSLKILKNRGKP